MSDSLIDRLVKEKTHRPAKDYAPTIKDWFKSEFKRDLPVANIGLSDFHRRVGWEHSRAFDVSLHPDSAEGKRLISYLQSQGIPYIAQTGASSKNGRVTSTGPHIHVGPPSSSMSKRSLVDRLVEQKSGGAVVTPSKKTDFSQATGGASGEYREKIDHPYNVSRILTEATHSPEAERRAAIRKQIQSERPVPLGPISGLASGLDTVLHPVTSVRRIFDPEGVVNDEVEERIAAEGRQSSPEVTAIRKEYGRMRAVPLTPVATRSIAQPLARAGGNILKLAGGVTSLAGLTPNKFSEWANERGRIVEEAASLPPLDERGAEIVQGLPEKVTTAIADTGLSIAQIVLLKKATGLPFGRLMGLEAALRTSDMPLDKRAQEVAKAAVLGKVLERHLSRKMSAAAFAGPTAAETGVAVSKGQMSLEDAILQTAVQGGTGFALGGGKKSLVDRLVAEKEATAEPTVKSTEPSTFDTYRDRAIERLTKVREAEIAAAPEIVRVEPEKEPWQIVRQKFESSDSSTSVVSILKAMPKLEGVTLSVGGSTVGTGARGLATKPHDVDIVFRVPDAAFNDVSHPFWKQADSLAQHRNVDVWVASEQSGVYRLAAGEQPPAYRLSEVSPRAASMVEKAVPVDQIDRHREFVRQALVEGKSVPSEVLAEYPDLAPRPETTSVEQRTVAAEPTPALTQQAPSATPEVPRSEPRVAETVTEATAAVSPPLTGTKVDITRAERQQRGLDPVQQQAWTAMGDAYNKGRSAVESGSIDPRTLAEEVAVRSRPLSDSEVGALGYDRARLMNGLNDAYRELDVAIRENRDVSDIQSRIRTTERALDFNDQALEKGGREQSAAFNARKMLVRHDYSLADVLQRAKAAKGAELTPKERVEYTELQQKYAAVLEKLGETERKTVNDALQRDINRLAKSQQRTETKELLDAEFAVLQTQFKQARKESGGVQASGFAGIDPEGKLTPLILKMAQNRIKAGVTKVEQLVDDIYNAVKDTAAGITPDNVREVLKDGLASTKRVIRLEKQIGEMEAGTWKPTTREKREPTDEEFRLIRKRDDLKRHIEAKLRHDAMSGGERFLREIGNVIGLYRSTMTAIDASFGLRQGKIGLSRHPTLWAEAWKKQWAGVSNEKYDRAVWRIENDPDFPLMNRFGLETPSVAMKHSFSLTAKNEDFPSEWTQKIPVLRQSEQMFNLMGDVLRTSWFKSDLKMLQKAGFDPNNAAHADVFRKSAEDINTYTGRTNLQQLIPGKAGKSLHQATPILNQLTFAIRWWASRLKVLSLPLDPRMYPQIPRTMKLYKSMPRAQRVEAWKTLFAFYGLVATQLKAAQLAGAEIDVDPDSPDFLKARFTGVSDRHFDVSAGMANHLRFAARMAKRIYEAKSGQPRKGFGNAPGEVAGSYLRSKESPPVSIAHDIFFSRQTKEGYGTNFKGEPVYPFGKPGTGVVGRLKSARLLPKPIVMDDAMEAYDEMGWTGVGTTMPFTFLGESVTVYKGKKKAAAK